ncbi:MAG: TIGR02270 family protein [Candidatus Competibacter sp.]|nr:TIGR02270 family protein [Candidatus Competibacter sp.]MDG4585743.1 TIGR02270 family protein [Candidatus Competibacter sp.]
MPATPSNTIKDGITHCIGEAKALWKKRQIGIDAPYFSLRDLTSLDSQINKQLDALRQNSTQSWSLLEQRFSSPQYALDDLLPVTVLAFSETAPPNWRDFLIELIGTDEQSITVVIETLGWLPLDSIKASLLQFLAAATPLHQRIALAVCAKHRADAGDYLVAALQSDIPELCACALKAVGELGRLDLLPLLRQCLTKESPDWRFWAAWSAVRMGERGPTIEILSEFALTDTPLRQHALSLLPRVLPDPQRQRWLETIKDKAVYSRDAITSVGAAGNPWQIPWLITQMQYPELARVAGEAFTLITGLDLVEHHLAQPTAPSSTNSKDPMSGLPWPNPESIATWWQTNETHFQRETRYLLGRPITPDHCLHVLVNGYQRQRAAAALELALIQTGMPLFAVHSPAAEQQNLLNVRDTLQVCVENAARLWMERDRAACAPMTTLPELTELDSRLEQQLTLLREAGDLGWKCCWDSLTNNRRPGAIFTAAATAVSHIDDTPFKQLTDHINTTPDTVRELIAALGWVAPDRLRGRVRDVLLVSTSPLLRYAGITVCGFHQVDPGDYLDAALKDSSLRLRARALRLVGELRLQRYLPVLRQNMNHADETLRFWAAWSASLLAHRGGLDILQQMVEYNAEPMLQQRAIELLARAIDLEPARLWIRQLLLDEHLTPLVIHGLGVLGDTSAIPWLIRLMSSASAQADLAGAALSLITGVDLVKEALAHALEPAENEPADTERLPRPNPEAVNQWWSQQRRRYKKDRCYLMGFPISLEVCWQVLVHGRQFQRAAAALELALLEPQTTFFPIEAPGFRQWEWLSAIGSATPAGDDSRSTVPLPSPSRMRSTVRESFLAPEALNFDADLPTIPRSSRKPRRVRDQSIDVSLVSARDALMELTRPIDQGWLFRRTALSTTRGNTASTVAEVSRAELDPSESGAVLSGEEWIVPLPEPTSATILTARNILSTHPKIQSEHPCPRSRSTVPLKRRKARSLARPESEEQRSIIILSPVTFEWYFEKIAELWQLYNSLATARYSLFHQLCETNNYLRSYLEYLPEITENIWKKLDSLDTKKWKAGHLFAASFIALKSNKIQRLRKVVNIALARSSIDHGFISAFGWIPPSIAKDKVHLLLNSKFSKWRHLGVLIVIINHIDCENFLENLSNDTDIYIKSLAIKAIGKLACGNSMHILSKNLRSKHEDHRFWAAWSAVLLGDRQVALEVLKSFSLYSSMPLRQQQALQLVLRVADRQDVDRWISVVAKHNPRLHAAMLGVSAYQNTAWISGLIESMCIPERAGFIGEAFTLLTGVDLIDEGLMRPRVIHPSESQFIGSTEQAQLLLPDAKAVQAWWIAHQDQYQRDSRYLLGREITLENCVSILKTGRQYQRTIAALELSLLKAKFPLLETQASSFRQQLWISHLKE